MSFCESLEGGDFGEIECVPFSCVPFLWGCVSFHGERMTVRILTVIPGKRGG